MSLQFYLGASGSGKSYQLHKDILNEAKKNKDTNYLIIVPDQFTLNTQKELVCESDCGGIMNIDVLSFMRLSHRIFGELGCDNEIVLNDTGKNLIVRALAKELSDQMPVLGKHLNKIGFEHEIKSIISEFKQYSITDDILQKIIAMLDDKSMLNLKLKDIALIYQAFNEYISGRFMTSEDSLTLLTNRLSESDIVKNAVVVFDGFTGFTPVQYALIRELFKLTQKVIVSITIDIDAKPFSKGADQELFYLSKKTIYDLQKIAQEEKILEDEVIYLNGYYRFNNSSELKHLERSMFRYPLNAYAGEVRNIAITEAESPIDEVRDVCLKIRDMVLNEGLEYRDIAIVCGDLSVYAEHFRECAKVYDLPVYIDETKSVRLNPFVEYIKSALNIIKDNYSYDAVLHFLRSGFTDFTLDEIDRLDNYILKCGIRGKNAWNKAFTRPPYRVADGESVDAENIEALGRLNESRDKLIALLNPIMNKKTSVSQFVEGLYEFIKISNAQAKLNDAVAVFKENGDFEVAKEYEQIYREIIDLLDIMHEILADEPMKIDEFIKMFDAGIEEIDVGTIPGAIDRLVVGDIERSRLGAIKVLMFLGVNDGYIPRANSNGGIISDMEREYLKDALCDTAIELSPSPREQIFSQRLYLYLNMTKPSMRLYLSYSRGDGCGKSLNKSYVIGNILKMYPKLKVISTRDTKSEFDMVSGLDDGLRIASEGLLRYASGIEYSEGEITIEELQVLFYALLKEPELSQKVESIINGAFYEYKEEPLSKDLAMVLYGEVLKNSVSRLERFSACQYAHFLQYGMSLYERDEFVFENSDLGNVYHAVLESFANAIANKGYTLLDYPDDEGDAILRELLLNESVNYGEAVLRSSAANEYKVNRIYSIMKKVLRSTKEQLRQGSFIPEGFERSFVEEIELSDNNKMLLRGKIDRIDICKEEDRIFVKIIDYKSGSKDIELDSLFYGLQLQQPVYMLAALRAMEKKYKEMESSMAAMLYFHIDDPILKAEKDIDDETSTNSLNKAMRPTGLVIEDNDIIERLDRGLSENSAKSIAVPVEKKKNGEYTSNSKLLSKENARVINEYTLNKIKDIGNDILNGDIKINPKEHDNFDACKYCSYKDICAYDTKIAGYKKYRLRNIKSEEAIEMMKEKL